MLKTSPRLFGATLTALMITLAAMPEPSFAGRFGKFVAPKPPVSAPARTTRPKPAFNRASGAASAHYINKTPNARERLRARLEQEARASRGMGSIGKVVRKRDGTRHETAYNKEHQIHYSRDVAPDGTVSGRHWTHHELGRRIGDRD